MAIQIGAGLHIHHAHKVTLKWDRKSGCLDIIIHASDKDWDNDRISVWGKEEGVCPLLDVAAVTVPMTTGFELSYADAFDAGGATVKVTGKVEE